MRYIITESQLKRLKEDGQEILDIPSVELFGGWDGLQEYLKRKGNPPYSIGGDLDLVRNRIESLGNLQSVGGYLNLTDTPIKFLGNLQSVGKGLFLGGTLIKSLGNLQSVGGYLDLTGTPIESFGNLISVGGDLGLTYTPISKKMTEREIGEKINVGGEIYL